MSNVIKFPLCSGDYDIFKQIKADNEAVDLVLKLRQVCIEFQDAKDELINLITMLNLAGTISDEMHINLANKIRRMSRAFDEMRDVT